MDPFVQMAATRSHLAAFYSLYLSGDAAAAPYVWGDAINEHGHYAKVYREPMFSVEVFPPRAGGGGGGTHGGGGGGGAPPPRVVQPGGEALVEGLVLNELDEVQAFDVSVEGPAGGGGVEAALLTPPRTGTLAPGDGAALAARVWAPEGAACAGGERSCWRNVTVSARSAADGGTTVYASVPVLLGEPAHCEHGGWGPWGPCDAVCGDGSRNRTRPTLTPPSGEGAAPCGPSVEHAPCAERLPRCERTTGLALALNRLFLGGLQQP